MIKKELKMTYKLKEASFMGTDELCDGEGNIVNLMENLKAIFPDSMFDITVVSTEKTDLEINDFIDDQEK